MHVQQAREDRQNQHPAHLLSNLLTVSLGAPILLVTRTKRVPPTAQRDRPHVISRAIFVMGSISIGLLFVVYTIQVLLLLFAGLLIGVALTKAASAASTWSSMPRPLALLALVTSLLSVAVVGSLLLAPQVIEQSRELASEIPKMWRHFTSKFGAWSELGWFNELSEVAQDPSADTMRNALSGFLGVLASSLGAIGSLLVVFIVALYLAATPNLYWQGAVSLLPKAQRPRAKEVAEKIGDTLAWWMVGKLLSMTVVGFFTFAGLWLLSVPLALSLAILAGLLAFIPNFGPILAAVPAVLLGFGESSSTGLYVVGLYVAIQTVESYAITPLIQRRTVSLPPAVTITAQLIMGVLAGGLGLALATPLAAAGLVLVRELYVQDQLECA